MSVSVSLPYFKTKAKIRQTGELDDVCMGSD